MNTLRPLLFLSSLLVLGACAESEGGAPLVLEETALAQPPEEPSGLDPRIEPLLYAPGLVLDHQARIALTPEQREAILDDVRATQARLVDLDARLREQTEALATALAPAEVEEPDALARARAVMQTENEVKETQLGLLVRVRNRLTAEQRAQLSAIRGASASARGR